MSLEIKTLTVSIKGRNILNRININVPDNDILAIVGESGSGKTMFAKSVMGLLPDTAFIEHGSIIFNGKDLVGISEKEFRSIRGSRIAMVFQEPYLSLNPVLTIGFQMEEVLKYHSDLSKYDRRAKIIEQLKLVSMDEWILGSYPHQLSGGMRQRVMISMALSCDPSLLILDEPTTALDVSIQKQILDLIINIRNTKDISIIFITHDFSVVNYVARNVTVMRDGFVVEKGNKDDILKHPENDYTKQLIDCIPRLGDTRARLPEMA